MMDERGHDRSIPPIMGVETEETLRTIREHINQKLAELALYVPNVSYGQYMTYEDCDADYSVIDLCISETTGEPNEREFLIMLPYINSDNDSDQLVIKLYWGNGGGSWGLTLPEKELVSPQDLLSSLLARDDLPDGLSQLICLIAQINLDRLSDPNKTSQDSLDGMELERVWYSIKADMKKGNIPTFYQYSHKADVGGSRVDVFSHQFLDNEIIVPNDLNNFAGFVWHNVSCAGDFTYHLVDMPGEAGKEYYIDNPDKIAESTLPPLTAEERMLHPYTVVPSNFGIDNSGELSLVSPYGFKIVNANPDTDTELSQITFPLSEEQCWKIADRKYQLDLAIANRPTDLNVVRAIHVLEVLGGVVEQARRVSINA